MGAYFEKGRGWRYDMRYLGHRYRSPRGFDTKRDAIDAEQVLRKKLKRQAAGLDPEPDARRSPRFNEWAGIYLAFVQERARLGLIKRPEIIQGNLRVVLRFFGAPPTPPDDPAPDYPTPYHDLRLSDPIDDPSWLRKFEDWLTARTVSPSTRNHYLSVLSKLYWLAQHPEFRHAAQGVSYNPFGYRPRSRWRRRTAIVTPEQLVSWLSHASYHARLVMAIAALAPKLRLANILALEWDQHIDLERRIIVVQAHKTDASGEPLVTAISDPLAAILIDARRRHPVARCVVVYRHRPVKTIDGAVKAAAEAAGLTWGRDVRGGVTFHSLRHSMSTLLARLGTTPALHQRVMGHQDGATTAGYTHLEPDDERPALERLASQVGIQDAVTSGPTRATRAKSGGLSGAGESAGGINRESGAKMMQKRHMSGLRRGPSTRR